MGSQDKTPVAIRQKALEHAQKQYLPRRAYTMVRVDGRSFHQFTKKMKRPYDMRLIECMRETMRALCEEADGCVLGYTQSDEITLVLADFGKETTQSWFGGNKTKIETITASVATAYFNRMAAMIDFEGGLPDKPALFDSRAWSAPDIALAAECLHWRMADATRNSVSMLAQAHFSHRELQGKSRREMLDMLVNEKGINWNDQPASFKRGSVCYKTTVLKPVEYVRRDTGERVVSEPVERKVWIVEDAPIFTKDDFLLKVIPQPEPLTQEALLKRVR